MIRIAKLTSAIALALALTGAAKAVNATRIAQGQFLEGVIFVGEKLYFVDYSASDVLRLDGVNVVKVWHQDGCGANGLVLAGDKLLVACYDRGTVVTITLDGQTVQTQRSDDQGHAFVSPNDLAADARGGFYLTSSGGGDQPGTVSYIAPDKHVTTVATGINNANGIALSPDGRQLYIGESGTSRVLAYPVEASGALGASHVLARLGDILSGSAEGRYVPDGIRTDRSGNLFICLYRGGGIAVLSPDGKLLAQMEAPGAHHTSLVLSADERQLFVTGIDDAATGSYLGALYAIPNPLHP